ncbi:hypothetical protein WJX73_001449 [Symbiochloris irregularis]|uniref:Fungal lipase-type domain-containing protein n=1 Tax=Symbiochloris irregularis TaxID=706552 RepID=A0AAW1P2V0_9CHLO
MGTGDGDLLQDTLKAASFDGGSPDRREQEVFLRVETSNATEAKVGALVVFTFTFLAWCAIIILLALKIHFDKSPHFSKSAVVAYPAACVSIAACLVTLLAVRFSIFTLRAISAIRRGLLWRPRRRRMAGLAWALGLSQLTGTTAWLIPYAFILARPCQFTGTFVWVMISIRTMCWGTTLSIYMMLGHSLLVWHPRGGPKAGARRRGQLLVLDAPLWVHLDKFVLWLCWLAAAVFVMAPWWLEHHHIAPLRLPGQTDCRELIYVTSCVARPVQRDAVLAIAILTACFFVLYSFYLLKAWWQLKQLPCVDARPARINFSLQARSILLAFKVVLVGTFVLRFGTGKFACWTFVINDLGVIPLEIIGVAVAWHFCFLYMPKDAESDPVIQVWLQDFAWTEEEVEDKIQQRVARGNGANEVEELAAEPIFCIETAIKLHHWSYCAYRRLEGEGEEDEEAQAARRILEDYSTANAQEQGAGGNAEGVHTNGQHRGHHANGTHAGESQRDSLGEGQEPDIVAQVFPAVYMAERAIHRMGHLTRHPSGRHRASDEAEVAVGEDLEQAKAATDELIRLGMLQYGLTHIEDFWSEQLDTKVLVAWQRNLVLLAFRGTASLANAKSDLKVWRVAHPPERGLFWLGTQPLVHSGFWRAWVADDLNLRVLGLVQKLYSSGEVDPNARVCVTGHSLGGALAMLAAHDIATQIEPKRLQVYTYGAPYPGNHSFCRSYEAVCPDTWHIVNDRDPVPRSGKFFCLFKRPGNRVRINRRGEMIVRPNPLEMQVAGPSRRVSHHFLVSYRAAIVAICQAQFGRRGVQGGADGVLRLVAIPELADLAGDLQKKGIMVEGSEWSSTTRESAADDSETAQGPDLA